MFGELQALALIIGAQRAPINLRWRIGETFENEPADGLGVLQHKRHLARADLQNRTGAAPLSSLMYEARIENARIMNAEFAAERVERHHLPREILRN